MSVTPASGSGASQTFGFVAADATSAANINWVEVLFNSTLGGVQACFLHYDQGSNTIYLRDDTEPIWVGSTALGAAGTLENSQCKLDAGGSSVTVSGANLTLNLALTFKPAFVGTQTVFMLVDSGQYNSGWSNPNGATWTIPTPPGALPTGWTSSAIGNSYPGNSASYASGMYTISGQGEQLWSTSDSFGFAYQPMAGDGTIVARITGVQNERYYSGFGVMLREGPTPTAANAFMGIAGPSNMLDFQYRASTGGNTTASTGVQVSMPYWVKLVRQGSTVTGYASPDGVTWSQVGSQTINLGATAYAGLAVASGEAGQVTVVTFDNVSITGGGIPDFTLTAAPTTQTVNRGGSASITVTTASLAGFNRTVSFALSGQPRGVTPAFGPAAVVPPATSTLSLAVDATAPPGTYALVITGTSGTLVHQTSTTMVVSGTPPAPPNITGVSPTSGAGGTVVTISGSGFGAAQGSGSVWLGSARGTVVSWSNTRVVAAVASTAQTGVVQVQQNGASSNSVPFSVRTATISTTAPTGGAAGTVVTITGSGFGATQGNGQVWLGTMSGVVQSWSDTQITAVVAAGSASSKCQVLQSGVLSNPVPFTVNALRIAGVTPGSGSVGTWVTITGTGFGSVQGQGTVLLGSANGGVISWSDTQVVATVAPGSVTGIARVQQNGAWSNAVGFVVPSSNPVTVVPNLLNMVVGDTRTIQALNPAEHSVTGLGRTSSDPSVVQLSTDDPPILTALAAGHVTVRAGSAAADVTVFPNTPGGLPPGTVLWSNPGNGSGVSSIVPAVPSSAGVADVFAFQNDGTVAAITSEGMTAWTADLNDAATGWALPDFQGGLIVVLGTYFQHTGIVKLDGITGQRYPAYTAGGSSTYFDRLAVHPDGTVFTIQNDLDNEQLVAIDSATGAQKFSVPLGFRQNDVEIIIAGDGFAYVAYLEPISPTGDPYQDSWADQRLVVLRVNSSGAYARIRVVDLNPHPSNNHGVNSYRPSMITNADKGILVSWIAYVADPFQELFDPVTGMATITGTSVQVLHPAVPGHPTDFLEPVVQAQDGSFVGRVWGSGGGNVVFDMVAFDETGNVRWIVPNAQPWIATEDGGVIATDTLAVPFGPATIFDQNGSATGQMPELLTQSWLANLYRIGSVVHLAETAVRIAEGWWPFAGANASANNSSVKQEWFPSLDSCTNSPGCIGPKQAIYNALSDLVARLRAPDLSAAAQANVFDKLGIDARGNKLTTPGFIAYLTNSTPGFYNGIRSDYCHDALTNPFLEHFCSDFNILLGSVATYFASKHDTEAQTATPLTPLRTFFRPSFILYPNSGKNLGNEATIFHEALHGLTGRFDPSLESALGVSGASCGITPYLQNTVLKLSPGLNPTTGCP